MECSLRNQMAPTLHSFWCVWSKQCFFICYHEGLIRVLLYMYQLLILQYLALFPAIYFSFPVIVIFYELAYFSIAFIVSWISFTDV